MQFNKVLLLPLSHPLHLFIQPNSFYRLDLNTDLSIKTLLIEARLHLCSNKAIRHAQLRMLLVSH